MILTNTGGVLLIIGNYEKAVVQLQNVIEIVGDRKHFSMAECYYFLAEALLGQNKESEALKTAIS